jgi:FAD synthase
MLLCLHFAIVIFFDFDKHMHQHVPRHFLTGRLSLLSFALGRPFCCGSTRYAGAAAVHTYPLTHTPTRIPTRTHTHTHAFTRTHPRTPTRIPHALTHPRAHAHPN